MYQGMWKRNNKHGNGTYTYVNGDVYSGRWVKNVKSGKGAYVIAESQSQLVGVWKKGKLEDGKWVHYDGTVYTGEFKNNTPTGTGLYTFPHGNQIEGVYAVDGEEEEEEEEEGEEGELPVTKPRVWKGQAVSIATTSSADLNKAEPAEPQFVPNVETLSMVNIESIRNTKSSLDGEEDEEGEEGVGGDDGFEVVMIVNTGETDVNLKGLHLSCNEKDPFIFRDDFELLSGGRVRVLSGPAAIAPPAEEEDVLNIVWNDSLQWSEGGEVKLYIKDDDVSTSLQVISSLSFDPVPVVDESKDNDDGDDDDE